MVKCEENLRKSYIVTWKEIRGEARLANEELSNIIDEIDPDSSYKLVVAEYLYGDLTVKEGVLQLPTKDGNKLIPIDASATDCNIKKELSYKSMPMFMVLDKSNEFFIDSGSCIIPLNLFSRGSICGSYESMDFIFGYPSNYKWNCSAGSRSIIILPKITNNMSIKKLCLEYGIPDSFVIRNLADHWELFKLIAQSKRFAQKWTNKILCFGGKWLSEKNNSLPWIKFRNYLFHNIWQHARYSISKSNFGLEWGKYAEAITSRRLKPEVYLLDQLKHILSVARGDYPAFVPMDNKQNDAPTAGLQKAFIEVYGLKYYLPTMLNAVSIGSMQKNKSLYYSLLLPTLLEGSPLKKGSSTIMLDLRRIKLLLETLTKYRGYKGGNIDKVIDQTKFEYFHSESDKFGGILLSDQISELDNRFVMDKKIFRDRTFCSTSQFLKGCIKITQINPLVI